MAQVDYFLKIEGVEGESKDAQHPGAIDITSWGWGASQAGTSAAGGGGGAGKVSMRGANFTAPVNKASPVLMRACATGEHLKKAVLTCRKAGKGQQEFLVCTLTDVLVSRFQSTSPGRGAVPTDMFTLDFALIEFAYKEQTPNGTLGGLIKGGWDLKKNKPV
jgi:type VI secretion system secreted protein Hcp